MKNQYIAGFLAASALFTVIGLAGCNNQKSAVLATVNGEPVTMEQYYAYLEAKPEVEAVLENGQVAPVRVNDTLGFQALKDLIRQRIIIQLAKDQGLMPNDKEINDEVEFQRSRDNQFVVNLRNKGLTLGQIKESLAVDLAREKLLTKDIKVELADVDKYITDNPKLFTRPAGIEAKWIFVKSESKMRAADNELKAGSSFATVARRISEAANAAQNQGYFPQTNLDILPPLLKDPLSKVQVGRETEWIKLSDGWAKFLVEKRTASEPIKPTGPEKEWLRRQLAMQRGIQANDLDRRLLEKLKKSDINVSYKELENPWKNAFDQIKGTSDEKSGEDNKDAAAE